METGNVIGAHAFWLIVALAIVAVGFLLVSVLLSEPASKEAWQGGIGYRKPDEAT